MNWPEAMVAGAGIFCGTLFLIAMLAFFAYAVSRDGKETEDES